MSRKRERHGRAIDSRPTPSEWPMGAYHDDLRRSSPETFISRNRPFKATFDLPQHWAASATRFWPEFLNGGACWHTHLLIVHPGNDSRSVAVAPFDCDGRIRLPRGRDRTRTRLTTTL